MQDWEREVMEAQVKQLQEWKKGVEALMVHLTEAQVHLMNGLLALGKIGGLATVPQSPIDPEGEWLPTSAASPSVPPSVSSKD